MIVSQKFRRLTPILAAIAVLLVPSALFAADDAREPMIELENIENIVYGKPTPGGLLIRLSKVERDLFGMELPGSLTERQEGLSVFVERGTASQPSLLFKIGVAEWVATKRVNSAKPLTERVTRLETTLEGEAKEGALSTRIESLLSKLLPGGVMATQVTLPAATVFKSVFTDTISVRDVSVGDIVKLETDEDCIIDGVLAVPKGSKLAAQVTKVKQPRSFGRASEIQFNFKDIETMSGLLVPVSIGAEARKAMDVDSGVVGAAGASVAGLLAFGPVGLVGGFLVRGNDKKIPEGSYVYVETAEAANVSAYQVPSGMNLMQGADTQVPAPTDAAYQPAPDDGAQDAEGDGGAVVY